jgi:predicted amidophosphoribosyltransferase
MPAGERAAGSKSPWYRYPLHRDREREHQAVPLMTTRPRSNKQVLRLEEHWESVRGAFATRPGSHVDKKCVLRLDDVMTTGSTLDARALALHASVAKSVMAIKVARATRNPLPSPDSGNL